MFEDYLQDSYSFLSMAEDLVKAGNAYEARRYFRSSVFCTTAAMEAFVNYLADSFGKAQSIPSHEILFLTDKSLSFSRNKGFVERTEYHRLEDKLRLLIGKFLPAFDFKSLSWNRFMEFKDLRDSLVHPREMEDEREPAEYSARVRAGLKSIIEIMSNIMKGMAGRPLRKQILDLIPD
ncbi:MAG TPA: hypothetical protein VNW97_14920 [Candidatus Saccharimonadales bacterium]|jgi:hypothetical protein|nr:hypothetical protein [Candidatus Saccharimonadales bacterium]